ncbi:MAG: hypothetical protein SVT52_01350, partial [Planctomycetota bacterium]|nr:hypothetical protein [Planctomycetota bacterium]
MIRRNSGLCVCAGLLMLYASAATAFDGGPAALKRNVNSPAINATLREAVIKIQKLGGIRIEVDWPALHKAGVRPGTAVMLKARRITVEQLLDLTVVQVGRKRRPLAWYVDDTIVRITTQQRVLTRRRLPTTRPAKMQPTSRQ